MLQLPKKTFLESRYQNITVSISHVSKKKDFNNDHRKLRELGPQNLFLTVFPQSSAHEDIENVSEVKKNKLEPWKNNTSKNFER